MEDTISHLGQPSLEYFKDNNASQVIDDFLGFVNGPVASLLIMGPDGLVSTTSPLTGHALLTNGMLMMAISSGGPGYARRTTPLASPARSRAALTSTLRSFSSCLCWWTSSLPVRVAQHLAGCMASALGAASRLHGRCMDDCRHWTEGVMQCT